MEHIGPVYNSENCLKLFNAAMANNTKNLFYIIKKRHFHDALGLIGLIRKHKENAYYELGVIILNDYKSKGYAYKATKLLLIHAFENLKLNTVVVNCLSLNTGANRISKALGFKQKEQTTIHNTQTKNIKWEITLEQFNKKRKGQLG